MMKKVFIFLFLWGTVFYSQGQDSRASKSFKTPAEYAWDGTKKPLRNTYHTSSKIGKYTQKRVIKIAEDFSNAVSSYSINDDIEAHKKILSLCLNKDILVADFFDNKKHDEKTSLEKCLKKIDKMRSDKTEIKFKDISQYAEVTYVFPPKTKTPSEIIAKKLNLSKNYDNQISMLEEQTKKNAVKFNGIAKIDLTAIVTFQGEKKNRLLQVVVDLKNNKIINIFDNDFPAEDILLSPVQLYQKYLNFDQAEKYDRALKYLQSAAEKNFSKAQADLAKIYLGFYKPEEYPQDETDGKKWLIRAAEYETEAMLYWAGLKIDENKLTEAEFLFQKAADAGNIYGFYNLGLLKMKQGKIKEAENYFEKSASAESFFNLGNIYTSQNNFEKAEFFYLKSVYAGGEEAFFTLANLYLLSQKYEEAENYLEQSANSGKLAAKFLLIQLYRLQGRGNDEKKAWLTLKKETDILAKNGQFNDLIETAKICFNYGYYSETKEILEIVSNFGEEEHILEVGIFYFENKLLNEAEQIFKKIHSKVLLANHYLGLIYCEKEDYKNALLAFQTLTDGGLKDFHFETAVLYEFYLHNPHEAEKNYLLAAENGTDMAYHSLGILKLHQKNTEEAKKYWLIACEKGNIYAMIDLANLFAEEKNEQCLKYWEKAAEMGSASAFCNIAFFCLDKGNYQKGIDNLIKAAKLGNAAAMAELGKIQADNENFEHSEKLLLQAIRHGYEEAFLYLGIVCLKQEKYDKSEKCFLKASEKNAHAALWLGILYLDWKKNKQAEKFLLAAWQKGFYEAALYLAKLYSGENKDTEAETFFRETEKKQSAIAVYFYAKFLNNRGRADEADVKKQNFIRESPAKAIELAHFYMNKDEFGEAEKIIAFIQNDKRESAQLLFLQANIKLFYDPENKLGLANKYFEKIVSIVNKSEEMQPDDVKILIKAANFLSEFYEKKANFDTAEMYKKITATFKINP